MDREIARKTWVIIVSYLQKKIVGSVGAVEIYHNGIYHRYEGKERLEVGLKKASAERFKLKKGTPMRYRQLKQDFGLLGNTTAASKVLEGT